MRVSPKIRTPAASRGKKSVHIVAAKFGPLIHCIRPMGPQKRTQKKQVFAPIFKNVCPFFVPEATAVWRWSNFLHTQTPAGHRPVRINMDETAIRLFQEPRHGLISAVARRLRQTPRSLVRSATRQQMRTMFTAIVMVCDDDDLQKKLPQILVLSKTIARQRDVEHMRTMLPPNIFLWTRDRAWTTSELMVKVVKTINDCLRCDLAGRQVIFSSDVYRAHITSAVWRAMARVNFFYFLIPAKMTWAMQPCDTHVFALFKRHLGDATQRAAVRSDSGQVPLTPFVEIVCNVLEEVVRKRSWTNAFRDLGLLGNQLAVSRSVLDKLSLSAVEDVGDGLPTLTMLQDIWPVGSTIPINAVFATVTRYVQDSRVRMSSGVPAAFESEAPESAPASSVLCQPETSLEMAPSHRTRVPVGRPLMPNLRLRLRPVSRPGQ